MDSGFYRVLGCGLDISLEQTAVYLLGTSLGLGLPGRSPVGTLEVARKSTKIGEGSCF